MDINYRCGVCDNCIKVERVRKRALAVANPPFSHADDDVTTVWNEALRDWPCREVPEDGDSVLYLGASHMAKVVNGRVVLTNGGASHDLVDVDQKALMIIKKAREPTSAYPPISGDDEIGRYLILRGDAMTVGNAIGYPRTIAVLKAEDGYFVRDLVPDLLKDDDFRVEVEKCRHSDETGSVFIAEKMKTLIRSRIVDILNGMETEVRNDGFPDVKELGQYCHWLFDLHCMTEGA